MNALLLLLSLLPHVKRSLHFTVFVCARLSTKLLDAQNLFSNLSSCSYAEYLDVITCSHTSQNVQLPFGHYRHCHHDSIVIVALSDN